MASRQGVTLDGGMAPGDCVNGERSRTELYTVLDQAPRIGLTALAFVGVAVVAASEDGEPKPSKGASDDG